MNAPLAPDRRSGARNPCAIGSRSSEAPVGATGHSEGKQRSERDREPLDDLHCAPPPNPNAKGLSLNALLEYHLTCPARPRVEDGNATIGGRSYGPQDGGIAYTIWRRHPEAGWQEGVVSPESQDVQDRTRGRRPSTPANR